MSYTITEKGIVPIPAEIRKKHRLRKGSRIKFFETDEGILLVPVIPFEELFGADRTAKETLYKAIKELQEERPQTLRRERESLPRGRQSTAVQTT